MSSNRTRGNRHKLKHGKLHLNMRKNFLTVRVTEHWNSLHKEAVESPFLEILKSCLDILTSWMLVVCSNLNFSVILWKYHISRLTRFERECLSVCIFASGEVEKKCNVEEKSALLERYQLLLHDIKLFWSCNALRSLWTQRSSTATACCYTNMQHTQSGQHKAWSVHSSLGLVRLRSDLLLGCSGVNRYLCCTVQYQSRFLPCCQKQQQCNELAKYSQLPQWRTHSTEEIDGLEFAFAFFLPAKHLSSSLVNLHTMLGNNG